MASLRAASHDVQVSHRARLRALNGSGAPSTAMTDRGHPDHLEPKADRTPTRMRAILYPSERSGRGFPQGVVGQPLIFRGPLPDVTTIGFIRHTRGGYDFLGWMYSAHYDARSNRCRLDRVARWDVAYGGVWARRLMHPEVEGDVTHYGEPVEPLLTARSCPQPTYRLTQATVRNILRTWPWMPLRDGTHRHKEVGDRCIPVTIIKS